MLSELESHECIDGESGKGNSFSLLQPSASSSMGHHFLLSGTKLAYFPSTSRTDPQSTLANTETELKSHPIILSMTLVNFMCHEYLKVDFGPHINFIVGQNGSGKSAILAGLMICLGANANKTQRGHKASSLIKEGASFFSVSIVLFNAGSERFQYEKFGASITIERKVGIENSTSTYKIKGHSGVSLGGDRPREMIREIVSYFRLQVENPLTLLTQDIAKRYLATSSPSERYRLVMQGSQLQKLSEDYEQTNTLIRNMHDRLSIASGKISEQQTKVDTIRTQLDAIKEAREMLANLELARRELVWVQIFSMEDLVTEALNEIENLKQTHLTYSESIQKQGERLGSLVVQEESLEIFIEKLRSSIIPPLRLKAAQIESQLSMLATQASNNDADERVLEQGRIQLLDSLQKIAAIEVSTSINSSFLEEDRKNRELLLVELKSKDTILKHIEEEKSKTEFFLHQKETELDDLKTAEDRLISSLRSTREQLSLMEARIPAAMAAIATAESAPVVSTTSTQSRHLSAANYAEIGLLYGPQMAKLVSYLDSLEYEKKPIGPIGRYVSLVDDNSDKERHYQGSLTWATAIDALIGRHMSSFVVSSYTEREYLHELFRRFDISNSQVILLPESGNEFHHSHSHSRNLTTTEYLTARAALNIASPVIERALCILTGIHRVLLSKDRTEAIQILSSKHSSSLDYAFLSTGQKITLSGSAQTFFSFGGRGPSRWFGRTKPTQFSTSSTNTNIKPHNPERVSFVLENTRIELEKMHSSIAAKRAHMSSLSLQLTHANVATDQCAKERDLIIAELSRINVERIQVLSRIRILNRELEEKSENHLKPPISTLSGINFNQQEATQRRLVIIEAQLKDLSSRRDQLFERQQALDNQLKETQILLSEKEHSLRETIDKQSSSDAEIRQIRASQETLRSRCQKIDTMLIETETKATFLSADYNDALSQAINHWEPMPLRSELQVKSILDAQKQVKQLEQQLEAQRRAHSSNSSSLQADANRLISELESTSLCLGTWIKNASLYKELVQVLAQSLIDRQSRWISFREIICKRADLHFRMFVSARGFYGRLLFDHDAEHLGICVLRPEQFTADSHQNPNLKIRSSSRSKTRFNSNGVTLLSESLSILPSSTSVSKSTQASHIQITSFNKTNQLGTETTDLKGLSGGEKSLVTSCLLLALWECVESPLRCLDEFDVFMDNVNRKTILKMLIEYAGKENSSAYSLINQYIFITPQALDLPSNSPGIKVIRLKDPQR